MLLEASHDSILGHDLAGTGTPVVLLHGLTFDRSSWRPVIDRLSRRARTVALDLPGHGQSPGPPMSLERLSEVIHRTLQALNVDRPVIVGHSMFGALALTYAAAHPVRGAVTVDSPLDVAPSLGSCGSWSLRCAAMRSARLSSASSRPACAWTS